MDIAQHYQHQELHKEYNMVNHLSSKKTLKHQKHIYTERQRRIYMSTLLESLQALLPDSRPKKDRCTLLSEVIDYVSSLEDTIKVLAKRKEEIIVSSTQHTKKDLLLSPYAYYPIEKNWRIDPSVTNLHVQDMHDIQEVLDNKILSNTKDVAITFVSSYTRGLWSEILSRLQRHAIDVINITFSTISPTQKLHYIHARIPLECNVENDDIKVIFSNLLKH